MKSTNSEAAQIILKKLGHVVPTIQEVLDKAIISAREYFEKKKLKIDSYLFPCLVRFEAKTLFENPKYKKAGYQFVSLSNNGLLLIYQFEGCTYKIRIRKADEDGELPRSNLSGTLRDFYSQPSLFLPTIEPEDMENYLSPDLLKLVVVWEIDSQHNLTDVHLVCPNGEAGDVYFAEKIEHAASAVVGNADFDDEPEEIDDIDIQPKRKTGTSD
jgi:hypothetical protein